MDEPVRFISTIQVGITVFGILLGAIGEPLISSYFDWLPRGVAFLIAFLILTYLSVVLGELVPKAIALQKAEAIADRARAAARAARPGRAAGRVAAAGLGERRGASLRRRARARPVWSRTRARTSGSSVGAAEDLGEFHRAEEEMLYKVFDFAGKEVHEVMVSQPEVVAIEVDLPPEECLAAIIDSPYTRYPAFRDSLDNDRRDPPRARPLLRAPRPRHRAGADRGAAATGALRPGDEGSRRAARRLPA